MNVASDQAGRVFKANKPIVSSPTTERIPLNENAAEGLHPDRADDRGRDHRYSGGGRAAGVSGLHDPRQDVGSDSGDELVPHVDHRGVPVWTDYRAGSRRLGLRDSHRLATDE